MATTQVSCPQCYGVGSVHFSLYDRTVIPVTELRNEKTWRDTKLNTDLTCKVAAESVKCRVCFGRGIL